MKTIDRFYDDWLCKVAFWCVPGVTLEVGSGLGHLSKYIPNVITSDIGYHLGLSMLVDAEHIQLKEGTISNIVAFDVIHHLDHPLIFLTDTFRYLRPGGRLIISEPYVKGLSRLVYIFHREPSQDIFQNIEMEKPIYEAQIGGLVYALTGGRTHTKLFPEFMLQLLYPIDKYTSCTRKLYIYEKTIDRSGN